MPCSIFSNPANSGQFAGVISAELKNIFNDAINALVEDGSCSVLCKLVFASIFEDCANCHNGIYQPGGVTPFGYPGQRCMTCNGTGKVKTEQEENINLICIWDSMKFWTTASKAIQVSRIDMETFCRIEFASKLRSAQFLIPLSGDGCNVYRRYKRVGDVEPCGLGDPKFCGAAWVGVE